ncbi:myophilin-like isoform X1 [Antedon mediterranea]|uniref:myophilin-like isoform X1 n=1 Tax=Antedon mediterranea TaxID=105859 RepID=UPI003AF7C1C3
MASQGPSFGMSAEVKRKLDGKRNPEQEQKVREFIEFHLGEPFPSDNYQESLKNGILLCRLLKKFHPGFTAKIDKGKMPFNQRCNVENFCEGLKTFGLQEMELFQVNDLFEGKNLAQVTACIVAFARHAQKQPGYDGPILAPKQSEGNVREFSDEQLKAGQYTIGLQMGTNKCASQAGQNFGLGRQVTDKQEHGKDF